MGKAEKTRQFIIEKTAPIFNKKGYAGTSMSDITLATGLTKGSIYGNFASKDEVALAVFDHNYKLVSANIRNRTEAVAHASDKLRVFLTIFSTFTDNPIMEGGCPVLNTAIEADDTHGPLRARAANAIGKWYAFISKTMEAGKEKGEIKPDADAADFAGAFIAILEGGLMLAKVTGKMDGMKAAVKQAEKMIKEITN